MGFPLQLSQQQYEALVYLAREGTKDANGQIIAESARQLESYLKSLEKANGIERDLVMVQWQEAGQDLPSTTDFPEVWPPEMRTTIELVTRKITRADVDAYLAKNANNPVGVLATRDPAGVVGWTKIDDFFIT